jgi:cytochrome c oxidase assembly protein subunit 15
MRSARALVLGFRTALALWVIAFLGRVSPDLVPGPVTVAFLLAAIIAGGISAGRLPNGGAKDGASVGFVAALVSLLLLGSLLMSGETQAWVPSASLWIPGWLFAGSVLGIVGAMLGRSMKPLPAEPDWNARFTRVAAVATLCLLAVGGLVTSRDAGLAVVDWPNSYGYNMFLYPLSRMTGNIFYEHAHRLFGSLVGLMTVALFIRLLITDRRRWVHVVAGIAVILVIAQGILGGLRVTGHFTTSTLPEEMRPNLGLAMVHGILAQLFLALMASLAAFNSTAWKKIESEQGSALPRPLATNTQLALILWVLVFVQLLLGVHLRHSGRGLMMHIVFSVAVVIPAVIVGLRLISQAKTSPILRKIGSALLGHTGTQFLLGIGALISTGIAGTADPRAPAPSSLHAVLVPTMHQTVGALLFANVTLAYLWCRRILRTASSAP